MRTEPPAMTAGCVSAHESTSTNCSDSKWSGGWQVRQRQPLGACASRHQSEPSQHEHQAPGVGLREASDQAGGRCRAARWRPRR